MGDDTIITREQLDRSFTEEVKKEPGGAQIDLCIGCGRCTATCPVQAVNTRFNPRRIVRMALMGMTEVLESDFVWLCAGCYSCRERCPQGVMVTDLMRALKNVAVRRGIVHASYRAQIAELRKYGRLYEVEPFNKKRGKIDLPPLVDDPGRVKGIFERTGLDEMIPPEGEADR